MLLGPDDRLQRNNAYYDRYAANVAKRTQYRDYTRAFAGFTAKLRPGATVLDIGCGSGEHLLLFRSLGYDVVGIDPSAHMRQLASAKGIPVFDGAFEGLSRFEDQVLRSSFVITDRWVEKSTWGRPSEWLSVLAEAD